MELPMMAYYALMFIIVMPLMIFRGIYQLCRILLDDKIYIHHPQINIKKHYVPKPTEGEIIPIDKLKSDLMKSFKSKRKKFRRKRFNSEGGLI
jgi:hypothetical protein